MVDNVGFGRSRSASTTSFSKTNEGLSFIFSLSSLSCFFHIHSFWVSPVWVALFLTL